MQGLASGFKSSEFYFAIIPTVMSLLVLFGLVGQDDASQLTELVKTVVSGIVAVVGIVVYVEGRIHLKINQQNNSVLSPTPPTEIAG